MSIAFTFGDDNVPSRWDADDAAKLEAAVEVLQRRHGLAVDDPRETRFLWHAIGALWPVLEVASSDPKCTEQHPAEVHLEDLPF